MGKNWAIAIGINHYDNLQPLQYAQRDAAALRNFCLQDLGFEQVYYFSDDSPPIAPDQGPPLKSQPTFGTLSRFLRVRFEQPWLQSGDNLWFFFAGHGKRHRDRDYLMPIDADPGNLEATALSIASITERLRRCGADNVILMLDACRNEGDRSGEGIGLDTPKGVVTLFSCSSSERSYEIDELQQGAFTHALLQGLRIQGEGNCATVERLDQFLRVQVPEINRRYGKPQQTPYASVEPAAKYHLILLPQQATLRDAETLKMEAFKAETTGKFELAEQLWIRVLAISPADSDAIKAIRRLATTPSRDQFETSSRWTLSPSSIIPNSGKRSQGTHINLLPLLTRRRLFCVGIMGISMTFLTKAILLFIFPKSPKRYGISFTVVTVDPKSKKIESQENNAEFFIEDLGRGIHLKMVYIPGGSFQMGAPKTENGSSNSERPQRMVTVQPFFMGMYKVTQEQWEAVSALKRVDLEFQQNSYFKGRNRPVEQVCWQEAVEFCNRLSRKTGHQYRLPSEAEWEYACRAGTMTPFHFGDTLTPKLANYNSIFFQGDGPQKPFQNETTDVGKFPPNAFGLYDMHGNVREWCLDYWHSTYEQAPNDGSAWTTGGDDHYRIVRGGSYYDDLIDCRSASRHKAKAIEPCVKVNSDTYDTYIGFRVVCSLTL